MSPGFIPSRHGAARARAGKMLGPLRRVVGGSDPTPERWRAIGEALMRGDQPMDDLIEWMFAAGVALTRPLFERALVHGIDSVDDAPRPLKEFFALIDAKPNWVDDAQVARGARIYQRAGADLVHAARDVAFVGGYQASAFNKTLILTGAMEKGPTRRFAETLQWALDGSGDGGLDRFGAGFVSTLRVRWIHAMVRRHVGGLAEWRTAEWGLPVNQIDMAATMLGVSTVPLLCAQVLGMPMTRRERDAATHHARYSGWIMGVEDRWLPRSDAEARALLYHLLLSITNPDETTIQLALPMRDEPLARPYRNLAWLRGRFERQRHLSLSRAFLGSQGMRNLGLPANVLPWYPAIALPVNLLRHAFSYVLPNGKDRQARLGRSAQQAILHQMTGALPARVGESAPQWH